MLDDDQTYDDAATPNINQPRTDHINDSIKKYWSKGYTAPNLESHIFRLCGRILKPEFNLPARNERLVDFGCGQGAAVNYFNTIGFNARGCDISQVDIDVAKLRYPHLSDKFSVVSQNPWDNQVYGWEDNVSVVAAVQSLYYLQRDYFTHVIEKFYASMPQGGLIYATLMGEDHTFFQHSQPTQRDWLRQVNFSNGRLSLEDYFLFFVSDEDDLKNKFSMFEPVHIGHYAMQLQDNDTNNWHWTFLGIKR